MNWRISLQWLSHQCKHLDVSMYCYLHIAKQHYIINLGFNDTIQLWGCGEADWEQGQVSSTIVLLQSASPLFLLLSTLCNLAQVLKIVLLLSRLVFYQDPRSSSSCRMGCLWISLFSTEKGNISFNNRRLSWPISMSHPQCAVLIGVTLSHFKGFSFNQLFMVKNTTKKNITFGLS